MDISKWVPAVWLVLFLIVVLVLRGPDDDPPAPTSPALAQGSAINGAPVEYAAPLTYEERFSPEAIGPEPPDYIPRRAQETFEPFYESLRAANEARQAEWDPGSDISLTYRGNELAGEAGEACNVLKKLERERLGLPGSRDTVEHLAEELADVVICADLTAMDLGINLDVAGAREFNATSEKVGLKTRMFCPVSSSAVNEQGVGE